MRTCCQGTPRCGDQPETHTPTPRQRAGGRTRQHPTTHDSDCSNLVRHAISHESATKPNIEVHNTIPGDCVSSGNPDQGLGSIHEISSSCPHHPRRSRCLHRITTSRHSCHDGSRDGGTGHDGRSGHDGGTGHDGRTGGHHHGASYDGRTGGHHHGASYDGCAEYDGAVDLLHHRNSQYRPTCPDRRECRCERVRVLAGSRCVAGRGLVRFRRYEGGFVG